MKLEKVKRGEREALKNSTEGRREEEEEER